MPHPLNRVTRTPEIVTHGAVPARARQLEGQVFNPRSLLPYFFAFALNLIIKETASRQVCGYGTHSGHNAAMLRRWINNAPRQVEAGGAGREED
jgi:hypothetical protein